jgi:F0F1-type ATP synthase membrane subunit c/vacuolar-type H+-ATPase subunit K
VIESTQPARPARPRAARGRTALRASVAAAALLGAGLAQAAPASAQVLDDGEQPGQGLSAITTILVFVGIPAALFVLIAVLTLAPSMARGPRYRPGLGWWAAPVWFNGPEDADRAVRTAAAHPTTDGGGASARW